MVKTQQQRNEQAKSSAGRPPSLEEKLTRIMWWFVYKHNLDPYGQEELEPKEAALRSDRLWRSPRTGAEIKLYERWLSVKRSHYDETPDRWWEELKEVFEHFFPGYEVKIIRDVPPTSYVVSPYDGGNRGPGGGSGC